MNATERILAALQQTEPAQGHNTQATAAPSPEPDATLRLIAATEQNRAALRRSDAARALDTPGEPANLEGVPPRDVVAPERERGRKRLHRVALGFGVVIVGTCVFLAWIFLLPRAKPGAAAPLAGASLQLRVEPVDSALLSISWNVENTAVTQAREARLMITADLQPPRIVALSPKHLRTGYLYYQSPAERTEFRLEVVTPTGTLVSNSAAYQAQSPAAAPQAQTATGTAPAHPATNARSTETGEPYVVTVTSGPEPIQGETRVFTPPQRTAAAEGRVILPEPSLVLDGGSGPPPAAQLPVAVNALSVPPAPAVKDAPPHAVTIGGHVQPVTLIKRIEPVYPEVARRSRTEGRVRFRATVGKDGAVQSVQRISGLQVLAAPAERALRQWVYRPALLDGKPVEMAIEVEINFSFER